MSNENIAEKLSNICLCCYNEDDNLRCIYKSYQRKGKTENYSEMLSECFRIEIKTEASNTEDTMKICEECIIKLRESLSFRKQIEISQSKLEDMMKHLSCNKNEGTSENTISVSGEFKVEVDDIDVISSTGTISEAEDWTSSSRNREFSSNPTGACSSDDILKRALERTQRNIQLLSETCQDPFKEEVDQETIPKDKKERKKFLRRLSYKRRIPFKLNKSDRICKECHQTFPSHKMLLIHMPEHYPNHICTQCGKMFILREHWKRHMSRHEKNIVTCDICKKSVKKDSLLRHIQAHSGDNFVHKCYYCEDKFRSYTTFINHMVNKHDHKSNEYKCHLCSKVFKVLADQKRHLREVHLGERRKPKPKTKKVILEARPRDNQ